MAHCRHDDPEWLLILGVIFIGIPLAVATVMVVVAGCYTVIWHVGHWVNWW